MTTVPAVPEQTITDNLEDLLAVLPPDIVEALQQYNNPEDRAKLLEIVLDLGRRPEARFEDREVYLADREITREDIAYVASRIGRFGDDNRAGIERTLHRISAIRSRSGEIVGLTCRIGRAVYGTVAIIRDLIESGESILLLGRPGVGKTTMLRETARVLADDLRKRVIVVDTSNEIAGDGDIPHPAIGRARRMQVPTPSLQHAVMIEAVENHMPEVIVIDEIGTELEAAAARTIAERGVQLIGTAHGNTLENIMMNPTLSDLIGGIQSVTLSDEEARRRGTQKSILERKAPPTFSVLVEIQSRNRVAVHRDVAAAVDAILRGQPLRVEIRERNPDGTVSIWYEELHGQERRAERSMLPAGPRRTYQRIPGTPAPSRAVTVAAESEPTPAEPVRRTLRLFPFGVSRNRLEQVIRQLMLPVEIVRTPREADAVVTLKNYFRKRPQVLREAEQRGVPVYVLRSNTTQQMANLFRSLFPERFVDEQNWNSDDGSDDSPDDRIAAAMEEAEAAAYQVLQGTRERVELQPQEAWIRRLQHQLAERYNLASRSRGREPFRRVEIYREDERW
ncbi:AAA family ATPase [Thermomicrobium sp. 4228-Ro]|uniref:R3H domain-containing nucleic acid-binding protein n=1 Tax=Thermomicrobium sp. 4228-Ro TaxID=2993937 RepID=UPI002248ADFD|nr:R3H domain-containing nucleic acid-binding protein [Thermomicrobium sp. 4228-Ro]MCX2727328.1 AAA family ATPase [Thermomicrobium sp. 4228-Ro]